MSNQNQSETNRVVYTETHMAPSQDPESHVRSYHDKPGLARVRPIYPAHFLIWAQLRPSLTRLKQNAVFLLLGGQLSKSRYILRSTSCIAKNIQWQSCPVTASQWQRTTISHFSMPILDSNYPIFCRLKLLLCFRWRCLVLLLRWCLDLAGLRELPPTRTETCLLLSFTWQCLWSCLPCRLDGWTWPRTLSDSPSSFLFLLALKWW